MGQETDFIWEKLELALAQNTLLKENNTKLTKERDELSARWENLNREVEKKFDYRAERVFDPTRFTQRVHMVVDFDEELYLASNIDMGRVLAMKVLGLFEREMVEHLKKSKTTKEK